MLKTHKLCKVCEQVKKNDKLLNRLYNSAFYLGAGQESLKEIWEDYQTKFTYEGLRNHCHKHQFIDDKDFSKRHLQNIAKKAEASITKKQFESKQVWDKVIEEGMMQLERGELSMKTADLLKAAKDKSDYDLKKKDQEMAMAEMIYFFASGENTESKAYDSRRIINGTTSQDNDPAARATGVDNQGEDGQGPVYHTITWDAITQGTDSVPPRDTDF